MRVLFANRYFPPDHSATSQMVGDLAFFLAKRGHEVVAIASRQRYDDAAARLARREKLNGVDVVRVATTRLGRGFLPGRALDYATFYLSAFFAILRRARRDDTVVAMTDPPLLSVVAALACALQRRASSAGPCRAARSTTRRSTSARSSRSCAARGAMTRSWR